MHSSSIFECKIKTMKKNYLHAFFVGMTGIPVNGHSIKRIKFLAGCHLFIVLLLCTKVDGQPATGKDMIRDTIIWLHSQLPLHFTYIHAGSFIMGSQENELNRGNDEGPVHLVEISRDFYMGKYEVTQAQWVYIMGYNPATFKGLPESSLHPVETVSWDECQEFITRLNELGIGTFRLPSEAEWEYTCRANTTTSYYWGNKMAANGSSEYAWANSRSFAMTNPVGLKKPNPWGLYDMSGNVWEWCSDWFGAYSKLSQIDPKGPESGKYKVFRGGSWYDFYESHRSANRHKHEVDKGYPAIGFRLIMEVTDHE